MAVSSSTIAVALFGALYVLSVFNGNTAGNNGTTTQQPEEQAQQPESSAVQGEQAQGAVQKVRCCILHLLQTQTCSMVHCCASAGRERAVRVLRVLRLRGGVYAPKVHTCEYRAVK